MPEHPNLTAEIVTFRALSGTHPDLMRDAAPGIADFLQRSDGFVGRHLSEADGVFTDHVVWTDVVKARAAATRLVEDPSAGAFLRLIDTTSVTISHGPIIVAQTRA